MTTHFERELREQPEILAALLSRGREAAERIAASLRGRPMRFAVLAARGSSDNAARYGQYLLGLHNSLVAALATPSLFTQYKAMPSLADALVIGISQSGQSPDIVEVLRHAREQGAPTLAITNEAASPLATTAELVFPLHAGAERAVAATKTYTTQLLSLAMLSAALRGEKEAWDDLAGVPGRVGAAIDANAGTAAAAARFREHAALVVLGRGLNLATASEIALKIQETSGVMAQAYSSADFLHGPMAVLMRGLPVLVAAPGPRAFDDLDAVLGLARQTQASLLAISDRREILDAAEVALPLPGGTPEWLSPLVAVVPGQLFALGLCVARGLDPDAPRGLRKVTLTR
jgi:glucosamine--fructose-6-phosphate aminotransferase (isomerizing)